MATSSSSPAAAKLLAKSPAGVQGLALDASRLIRRVLPDIEENADLSSGILSYAYGPGYNGMVCTLILSRSGVKLGLVRGAALDDPDRLLQGRGKVHKHVQFKTPADVKRPAVSRLLAAALAAWRERNGRT
jgi:hypothetical protein